MIFMNCFARSSRTTGPEDPGADRLVVVGDDDGGVPVKSDGCAVITSNFLGGAYDNCPADVAFLDATARYGFLDRNDDDIAHGRVLSLGTAENLDALNAASAAVVSNIQIWSASGSCGFSRPLGTRPQGFDQNGHVNAIPRSLPIAWSLNAARIPGCARRLQP